ncbi:MAG: ATP-dependent Clp protease adaptor ClpS [Bacteroidota bacterium]|jgi:ATP-dependent Clp protease adaptor protein ClpS
MQFKHSENTETLKAVEEKVISKKQNSIIIYNDDVNTFDFVINSLIEVCEHNLIQAEQCTFIIHYKGKCEVKKGDFTELRPIRNELTKRGLTAVIE